MRSRHAPAAFSLVELLVVISIIGVLIALLLPAVQMARESARGAQCRSNLHQIGIALDMYIDSQGINGRFPMAAEMFNDVSNTYNWVSLAVALAPFIEQGNYSEQYHVQTAQDELLHRIQCPVFHCPDDVPGRIESSDTFTGADASADPNPDSGDRTTNPNTGFTVLADQSYYEWQDLSYDYPSLRGIFNMDLKTTKTRAEYLRRRDGTPRPSGQVTILFDFEPFHASRGSPGSRNWLYLDGHVENF
jgi:prepilin-type N-terminal cleavage/methylation domain-containing protein/prepilin-type processing-associated H-X9-DG protein